ncbi:hypothetical protein ACLB2K_053926 [Fragaria x ananassa]
MQASDRFNINSQLEHLQAKYVGTGHADLHRGGSHRFLRRVPISSAILERKREEEKKKKSTTWFPFPNLKRTASRRTTTPRSPHRRKPPLQRWDHICSNSVPILKATATAKQFQFG